MKKSFEEIASRAVRNYRVKPGAGCVLDRCDPDAVLIPRLEKKAEKKLFEGLHERLTELQELLYAQHAHKVLVVLQGMDTAGKDGIIRNVFTGVDPQGVSVSSFKVPTQEEADHDYLWRAHRQTPDKGQIVIFNRSYYEDVLAARVHKKVTPEACRRRFAQINAFERMLCEEGTLILKFFLHIDKEEQKKRLEERLRDPRKNWKFNPADMRERRLWPQYMNAYEEAIHATSSSWAPWYVIPSNKNWNRNCAVMLILVQALMRLDMEYPVAGKKHQDSGID